MAREYDHKEIESKWQAAWEERPLPGAKDGDSSRKKSYILVEFPYPSGVGLHAGHVRSYTAFDVLSRKRRMQGENVLYPMGWDAFGLPTENYAIKTGRDPKEITKENTDTFRSQMKRLGIAFDWAREVNTTDPSYYKWTQWIFLKLYEHGLAYKATTSINWCPKDKIGLANEEVVNGCCERCGTPVEKRDREQWMLAITKYARRLYDDLDTVNFIERAKVGQRNWIGPSEGAEIDFALEGLGETVRVFTTRPDTLFGATYVVLSPEHALLEKLESQIENLEEVRSYQKEARAKTEIERTDETREKTGVLLKGVRAINPANNESLPVFIADYVLAHYGTGAIMAVPAHDERDFAFAKKFGLPIKEVILPRVVDETNPPQAGKENTFRRIILAIVYNPKNNTYLTLDWKKQPWKTFITGGLEEGEDPVTAAQREIAEETGYTDVRLVRVLGGMTESHFYAAHKGVNRQVHNQGVLFELISEHQEPVAQEEKEQYDIVWRTAPEVVAAQMQHAEFDILWRRVESGSDLYTGEGVLIDSGNFSGAKSEEAKKKITELVKGEWKTTYKLRDWVFSRQRYWGEPIPMVFCNSCGWVPVPEKDLPVTLPEVAQYEPTETGDSPLASIDEWVNTTCPSCGKSAKRETDVMPNWAGSSWYYLRYCDPKNDSALADPEKLRYWLPVDWYNGGMEHTTLHLLYSRFWHKFLFDIGVVPTAEPYQVRTSHGMILGEGGEKMSKSKGNVVNPDDVVERFGADTLRVYEMFMGPFDQSIAWSTDGLVGARRFIERLWKLQDRVSDSTEYDGEVARIVGKAVQKVEGDIEVLKFNTAVSALMIAVKELEDIASIPKVWYSALVACVAPIVPHIAEELWSILGHEGSVHETSWPKYDEKALLGDTVTVVIQVNGKSRGTLMVQRGMSEGDVMNVVLADPKLSKWVSGRSIQKTVYVQDRLMSLVVDES